MHNNTPEERLKTTFEIIELAEELAIGRLKALNPGLSREELEIMFRRSVTLAKDRERH